MPELPEVETIRQYLAQVLPGQAVISVEHLDGRMVKEPKQDGEMIARKMAGLVVQDVMRRGKFLFIRWANDESLMIHLGMSGRLVWTMDSQIPRHGHLMIHFSQGRLLLVDPRRFGRIGWVAKGDQLRAGLGVEPLGPKLTTSFMVGRLAGRTAAIKSLLLDQKLVAGIGNIYADEALFRARIHPKTMGRDLSNEDIRRLVKAIRAVLREGLKNRGTSFSDYVDALGKRGDNRQYLRVYGREGLSCRRCGTNILTELVQKRTSHYCPQCQKLSIVTQNHKEGVAYAEV